MFERLAGRANFAILGPDQKPSVLDGYWRSGEALLFLPEEMRKDLVDWPDISDYIKPGIRLVCPAGGTYTIGVVGTNASCSVPGHVLPTGLAGCGK